MTRLDRALGGRRVLITGHTGFKGSWLALWLTTIGAKVAGLALPPETVPSHWSLLRLEVPEINADIRDFNAVRKAIQQFRPELIFHLAAQAEVRRSYVSPLDTWAINVVGTANLLEACRSEGGVLAIVVATSDKCYENREWVWAYRETDRLGGWDPYSASKAASELLVASYRRSFYDAPSAPALASVRAGNVIGGGDWSESRLIPDVVRALIDVQPAAIRSPGATRPWQHVLDALYGYLLLAARLLDGDRHFACAWNFGPADGESHAVSEVLGLLHESWPAVKHRHTVVRGVHEAEALRLDSSRARQHLAWRPVWDFPMTVRKTALWYQQYVELGQVISREQLAQYRDAAGGTPYTAVGAAQAANDDSK